MCESINEDKMIDIIYDDTYKSCIEYKVGGPFGAVVFKDGQVVGKGVNRVVGNNDPTAHAEIEAIRNACKNLKTYDLSGCELYATGYPCPMCMSAIIWSNIKKVYYSADYKDAKEVGFRDDYIFNFIRNGCNDDKVLELQQIKKDKIIELYNKYSTIDKQMY